MSKTSLALLLMFFISLVAMLSLNTLYSSNPVLKSLPAVFPTESLASENSLSIAPNPVSVAAGQTTTLQVLIDSRGETPSLIQMELAYDPTVISKVTLSPGTFLPNAEVPLNKVNARNGRISYALSPQSGKNAVAGSNLVATVQVTTRQNAQKNETSIYFLPKTIVRTKTLPNTLKSAYGTKITLHSLQLVEATPSASF